MSMSNTPSNITNLPICPTPADAGVAGNGCAVPGCGSEGFAGFSQVSEVEASSILKDRSDFPEDPEVNKRIFEFLSLPELLISEQVSRFFCDSIFQNHLKEIAYFRQLPETLRCRVAKWIMPNAAYLSDFLARFSTTKDADYFHAIQHEKPNAFREIMYFNLRETIGRSPSFDAERKAVMVHENRVNTARIDNFMSRALDSIRGRPGAIVIAPRIDTAHEDKVRTVQFSIGIPQILSSSAAEVKVVELIRGTRWVETLSIPYDREFGCKYSAQFIANGTCLVINNGRSVKIIERSRDGKWDHKISLFDFDNSDTFRLSRKSVTDTTIHVSPNSCNVWATGRKRIEAFDDECVLFTTFGGKNSDGKWIELPVGMTNKVSVMDVTRDGRCALVRDGENTYIYEQSDEGLMVSTLSADVAGSSEFSPDGTRAVSICGDRGAKVYIRNNQGDWLEEYVIPDGEHTPKFVEVRFSPDGTTIVFFDLLRSEIEIHGQQQEGVWGKQAVFCFRDYPFSIDANFIFSPSGTHVLIKSPGDWQRIMGKLGNGSWVEKVKATWEDLFTFSPDEAHVAVLTNSDQLVTLKELNDGPGLPEVAVIKHSQKVHSVQFSADGSHVVTGSDDGLVRIWGPSGKQRWIEKAIIEHDEPVHLVQFVMETTHVLACCDNKAILYELKPSPPHTLP